MKRNGGISAELARACAGQPSRPLGTVQPHGFLMTAQAGSGRIVQVSSGIVRHWPGLGDAGVLIGAPLFDWIERRAPLEALALDALPRSRPMTLPWRARFERTASHHAKRDSVQWECVGHLAGAVAVLEWLPRASNAGQMRMHDCNISDIAPIIGRLRRAGKMDDLLDQCAEIVQGFTAFDHVMIYRFLPDGSGEVVAEHSAASIDRRFIGWRLPAPDNPAQARALYLSRRLRVLADVEAPPDALVPAILPAGEPLDQSRCMLGVLSPVQLCRLPDMGVRAALTMSIVIEGEPWGLIACLHPAPKLPPHQVREGLRQVCELTAEVTSMRIETLSRLAAADQLRIKRTLHEQLHWRDQHDRLTGLYNRHTMEDEVARRLEEGQFDAALMLLDLEHFRKIKHGYGRAFGDQVLLQLGRRVAAAIRDCDLLARLGGGEFMLMVQIDHADPAFALTFAERLHQTVTAPFDINGQQLRTSISVGIAIPPGHGRTAGELLRRAGLALDHARSVGRSRSAVFDVSMEPDSGAASGA
jgi:diguanylate cyclase (GGDEF)-like protein